MKTNLFTRIERVLAHMPHGWCSVRKAHTLASIILATRPALVVEIGVYGGRSFVPMVMALAEVRRQSTVNGQQSTVGGVAIGIDPYDAAVSAAGEVAANAEWWGNLDHGEIEKHARTVMGAVPDWDGHWDLVRKRSDDVDPPDGVGLLHVDGAHTEQAYRDVERFAEHVMVGGYVVLDDLLWEGGQVSRSIEVLTRMGFDERFRMIGQDEGTPFTDNWGVFQRVKNWRPEI